MRTLKIIILLVLTVGSPTASAQAWLSEVVTAAGGLGSPDSLVAAIRVEMLKGIGELAPHLPFVPIGETDSTSVSDIRGEAIIVMLWHTYCSGCRMQIPELSRLHHAYAERGLEVVYVSDEDEVEIQNYLRENEVAGIVGQTARRTLPRPYQYLATPSAYLLDESGLMREAWTVPKEYGELEAMAVEWLQPE